VRCKYSFSLSQLSGESTNVCQTRNFNFFQFIKLHTHFKIDYEKFHTEIKNLVDIGICQNNTQKVFEKPAEIKDHEINKYVAFKLAW
jgi:hypothetical protein